MSKAPFNLGRACQVVVVLLITAIAHTNVWVPQTLAAQISGPQQQTAAAAPRGITGGHPPRMRRTTPANEKPPVSPPPGAPSGGG